MQIDKTEPVKIRAKFFTLDIQVVKTVKYSEPKFVQSLSAPAFAQTGVYKVKPSSSSSSQSSPLVCTYIAQSTSAKSVIFFIMITIISTRLFLHCTKRTASYPSPPGKLLLQMRRLCPEVVSRTQKLFSMFS